MAEKISISLDEKHIRIVERYGKKIGISAFSTALQAILHQFDQQQKAAEADEKSAEPEPTAA